MKKIIFILIAIVLTSGVIVAGVGYYRTKNQIDITTTDQQKEKPQTDVNRNDQAGDQDVSRNNSDLGDLKTYRFEELGFEFQYPSVYTFLPKNKDWDQEMKNNISLEGYRGSYFFGELSMDGRRVMQFMFLSNDYRESAGRGGGFSDNNRYVFNAQENKYYIGHWWDDALQEVVGSVRNAPVDGREGIIIDYNEFLKRRDCVAGYPFPYLASLIKTGWDKYPFLTISVYDVLTDPEKCIYSKPLPDNIALQIIKSVKFDDR